MTCPACGRALAEKTVASITVDVCEGGCGGIWFDRFELDKVDEAHEGTGEALLDIARDPSVHVNGDGKRSCPKCQGMTLRRNYFSAKREIEVDECPKCAGMWLDAGELGGIREQFTDEAARVEAAHKYFDDLFGDQLKKRAKQRDEEVARARKVANAFRFICPSNYIPGKQEWGAF